MKRFLHILIPAAFLLLCVLFISIFAARDVRRENRAYSRHFSGMLVQEAALSDRLDSLRVLEDSTRRLLPDRAMVVCVEDVIGNQ